MLLGALGAVLEASWAHLGVLLGHLGAILRLRKVIGSEKAGQAKILILQAYATSADPLNWGLWCLFLCVARELVCVGLGAT